MRQTVVGVEDKPRLSVHVADRPRRLDEDRVGSAELDDVELAEEEWEDAALLAALDLDALEEAVDEDISGKSGVVDEVGAELGVEITAQQRALRTSELWEMLPRADSVLKLRSAAKSTRGRPCGSRRGPSRRASGRA